MEVFLRILLVLVMLFPLSEANALTHTITDSLALREVQSTFCIGLETSDNRQEISDNMHILEKTICQQEVNQENREVDACCSFVAIPTTEVELLYSENFKRENKDWTLQDATGTKMPTKNIQDKNTYTEKVQPVFFVKTNILYDLLTFVNGSLEIPLTKNITAEATVVYPWWRNTEKHRTIQMRYVAVTPRYYFQKSENPYTSYFFGLTIGSGIYDLQWTRRGVQGSFWHVSPVFGYSHHISKRWKMEYAASVGFITTKYKKYTQTSDTPYGEIKVKDYPWVSKVLNTVVPTSLSVSLVYTFTKRSQHHAN